MVKYLKKNSLLTIPFYGFQFVARQRKKLSLYIFGRIPIVELKSSKSMWKSQNAAMVRAFQT